MIQIQCVFSCTFVIPFVPLSQFFKIIIYFSYVRKALLIQRCRVTSFLVFFYSGAVAFFRFVSYSGSCKNYVKFTFMFFVDITRVVYQILCVLTLLLLIPENCLTSSLLVKACHADARESSWTHWWISVEEHVSEPWIIFSIAIILLVCWFSVVERTFSPSNAFHDFDSAVDGTADHAAATVEIVSNNVQLLRNLEIASGAVESDIINFCKRACN